MGNTYSQENLRYDKNYGIYNLGQSENPQEDNSKKDVEKNRNSDSEDDSSSVNSGIEREPLDIDSLENIHKLEFGSNQSYSFHDYFNDHVEGDDYNVKDSSTVLRINKDIDLDLKHDKEKTIPISLHWKGDNQSVYVTGTFTGWKKKILLNKSMNDFTTLINLPKGTHRFKFLVDNEWKCSDELATATDSSGNLVNYIEVSETCLSSTFQNDKPSLAEHRANKPLETYTNKIPSLFQTALENNAQCILSESYIPPSLPPHLEKVILNSNSTMKDDQSVLPNPNHVVLNHLAASSIRNGVLAVSVTTRFRRKVRL